MSYRILGEAEVSLPQDLFPNQAYVTFAMVRIRYLFREKHRVSNLVSDSQKVIIHP